MEQLLIEAARRDLQMMLNKITPNHIEILVGMKQINVEGVDMPMFEPMEICKN